MNNTLLSDFLNILNQPGTQITQLGSESNNSSLGALVEKLSPAMLNNLKLAFEQTGADADIDAFLKRQPPDAARSLSDALSRRQMDSLFAVQNKLKEQGISVSLAAAGGSVQNEDLLEVLSAIERNRVRPALNAITDAGLSVGFEIAGLEKSSILAGGSMSALSLYAEVTNNVKETQETEAREARSQVALAQAMELERQAKAKTTEASMLMSEAKRQRDIANGVYQEPAQLSQQNNASGMASRGMH